VTRQPWRRIGFVLPLKEMKLDLCVLKALHEVVQVLHDTGPVGLLVGQITEPDDFGYFVADGRLLDLPEGVLFVAPAVADVSVREEQGVEGQFKIRFLD
jgi:hypothetical protein